MANNFDQLPIYDAISKMENGLLTEIWVGAFSFFIQNLTDYLTQGGILLPLLTTSERDDLQNIQNGQTIYNTTLDTAQYYKAGTWTSF